MKSTQPIFLLAFQRERKKPNYFVQFLLKNSWQGMQVYSPWKSDIETVTLIYLSDKIFPNREVLKPFSRTGTFLHCSVRLLFVEIINWYSKSSRPEFSVVNQVLLKRRRYNNDPRDRTCLSRPVVIGTISKYFFFW